MPPFSLHHSNHSPKSILYLRRPPYMCGSFFVLTLPICARRTIVPAHRDVVALSFLFSFARGDGLLQIDPSLFFFVGYFFFLSPSCLFRFGFFLPFFLDSGLDHSHERSQNNCSLLLHLPLLELSPDFRSWTTLLFSFRPYSFFAIQWPQRVRFSSFKSAFLGPCCPFGHDPFLRFGPVSSPRCLVGEIGTTCFQPIPHDYLLQEGNIFFFPFSPSSTSLGQNKAPSLIFFGSSPLAGSPSCPCINSMQVAIFDLFNVGVMMSKSPEPLLPPKPC